MMLQFNSAQELREHYKAVRSRLRQKELPAPQARAIEIQISQPEVQSIPVVKIVPVALLDEQPWQPKRVFVSSIIRAVCRRYKVTRIDIMSRRRTANIVRPRQVVFYLARHLTTMSLPEIGRLCGGKDHTSVLWGIHRIEGARMNDATLDDTLKELEAELS